MTADERSWSSRGASPAVASVLAGVAAGAWTEAILRYLATSDASVLLNIIIPERTGNVALIWLMGIVVGVVVGAASYVAFRRRRRIGSVRLWIAILLVSAILQYL